MTKNQNVKEKIMRQKNKNSILWITMLVNFAFLIVFILLFYPRFDNEGDAIMQALLYGINGNSHYKLVFSNVIIGRVLVALLDVFPNVAWYTVFHYICVFVALWCISYVTVKRNNSKMGYVIACTFIMFFGYESYVLPNYIKTSGLLAVAALYYLVYYLENNKKSILRILLFSGISIVSSLISFKIYLFITATGVILILIYSLFIKLEYRKLLNFVITVAAVFLLSFGGFAIDKTSYKNEKIGVYKASIEKLLMLGCEAYDEDKAEELGFEGYNEYANIARGLFFNGTEDEYELVKEVSELKKDFNIENIDRFYKSVPIALFKIGIFYFYIILLFVLSLSEFKHKKSSIAVSVIALDILLLLAYFNSRLGFVHVYFVIFMPICLYMLITIQNAKSVDYKTYLAYIMILNVILYNRFSSSFVTSVNKNDMNKIYENRYEEIISLLDINTYVRTFSIFKPYATNLTGLDNVYFVNGIYTFFDDYDNVTQLGNLELEHVSFYTDEELEELNPTGEDVSLEDDISSEEIDDSLVVDSGEQSEDDRLVIKEGNYMWLYQGRSLGAEYLLQSNLEDFYAAKEAAEE